MAFSQLIVYRELDSNLSDSLVTSTRVVCLAIGEEPVDDNADDGEEEDQHTPQELV